MRWRLPGPQLPAQAASSPVKWASAPAANAATSSCRTWIQESPSCCRIESVMPFSESPETPYIRRTPDPMRVSTRTSATRAMVASWKAQPEYNIHGPAGRPFVSASGRLQPTGSKQTVSTLRRLDPDPGLGAEHLSADHGRRGRRLERWPCASRGSRSIPNQEGDFHEG